jgi:PilZ domain
MVLAQDPEAPMPNPAREPAKAERRNAEQRMTLRRPTRRAATVTFAAEKPPVACVIWDISDGGARLAVAHPLATLPHHFTLNLSKDESVRRYCEVVWTDTRFVGVKFTNLAP